MDKQYKKSKGAGMDETVKARFEVAHSAMKCLWEANEAKLEKVRLEKCKEALRLLCQYPTKMYKTFRNVVAVSKADDYMRMARCNLGLALKREGNVAQAVVIALESLKNVLGFLLAELEPFAYPAIFYMGNRFAITAEWNDLFAEMDHQIEIARTLFELGGWAEDEYLQPLDLIKEVEFTPKRKRPQ